MSDLKEYDAKSFSEKEIVLKNIPDIGKLSKQISEGEDFIIRWAENGKKKGKMVKAASISAAVDSGNLEIFAEED